MLHPTPLAQPLHLADESTGEPWLLPLHKDTIQLADVDGHGVIHLLRLLQRSKQLPCERLLHLQPCKSLQEKYKQQQQGPR